MADYKATDTEFQAVANAIRTKGGTQAQLEWPTGFVNAIGAIPSGGGVTPSLPNTDQNKILCFAHPGNYSDSSNEWGGLTLGNRNCIAKSGDNIAVAYEGSAYYDFSSYNYPFTAYFVGCGLNSYVITTPQQYGRFIDAIYQASENNGPNMNSHGGKIVSSLWGSWAVESNILPGNLNVMSMAIGNSKDVHFYINGVNVGNNTCANSGNRVTFCNAKIGSDVILAAAIRFLAVVDECESSADIIANHQHLMQLYGIT